MQQPYHIEPPACLVNNHRTEPLRVLSTVLQTPLHIPIKSTLQSKSSPNVFLFTANSTMEKFIANYVRYPI